MATIKLSSDVMDKIEAVIRECEEKLDDDSESIITNERYAYVARVVDMCAKKRKRQTNLTASDRIDKIVTNRFLALPIFGLVMFAVYYISVTTVGAWATDWTNDVLFGDVIPPAVEGFLASIGTAPWLMSLVLDGIIGGVGAVLGFLPQLMVLFLLLSILEDSGYMARIAFIMDRIFRRFGLSGKSFIPILIGTGCGIPGVMASRTIENESDRKMTIITTTFIPCAAKLPIIALIAGALFGRAAWVAPTSYFIGIAAIVSSGIILKKFRSFAGDPAPFVMELPAYHVPRAKGVLIHMWERAKSFVVKAGTIIFVSSVAVWFLSSFSWSMHMVETSESMLSSIGNIFAPIFSPLGFGQWEASVATMTGLVAKENLVSTLGILYGLETVADNGVEIWANLQAAFTPLAAFSLLVFNLLCAPCFAAIGAIHREMGNARWTWFAVAWQTGLAYAASLCIYQFGMLFGGHGFGIATAAAVLVAGVLVYLLLRKAPEHGGMRARSTEAAELKA